MNTKIQILTNFDLNTIIMMVMIVMIGTIGTKMLVIMIVTIVIDIVITTTNLIIKIK